MNPIEDPRPDASPQDAPQRDRPEFVITLCQGGVVLSENDEPRGWYRTEAFAAAAAITAAQDRGAPGYVIHYT